MGFRFGLEAVLKHRKRLEEAAQREFIEAQAAVEECLRRIEAMYERMDEVREEILEAQRQGSSEHLERIREMESFLVGEKIRVERLRLQARELLMIAEAKQEALIEAARDHKILAKLKERRMAQYTERLRQIEAKELDDLTNMRFARRKR